MIIFYKSDLISHLSYAFILFIELSNLNSNQINLFSHIDMVLSFSHYNDCLAQLVFLTFSFYNWS